MTKVHNFNKYLLEKCLIGNGIINGIINALIFFAMHKSEPNTTFMTTDIVIDLSATSLILALIVFPLTAKDLNAGKITRQEGANKIVGFLPKNKYASALVIGIITMVIIAPITWALVMVLNLSPMTVKSMGIFKGIMCAVAGMIAGFMTILKAVSVDAK